MAALDVGRVVVSRDEPSTQLFNRCGDIIVLNVNVNGVCNCVRVANLIIYSHTTTSTSTLSGPRHLILQIIDVLSVNHFPLRECSWSPSTVPMSSIHLPSVHHAVHELLVLHDLSANAGREAIC